MNEQELRANPDAAERIVHDLNGDPRIPLADASVDDAVCCVSVDYLTQPVDVFRDVARVLRPGGRFVCTFSNRVFVTKAVRGWLYGTDDDRCAIVADYFARSRGVRAGHGQPAHAARPPRRSAVRRVGEGSGGGDFERHRVEQLGGGPADQEGVRNRGRPASPGGRRSGPSPGPNIAKARAEISSQSAWPGSQYGERAVVEHELDRRRLARAPAAPWRRP